MAQMIQRGSELIRINIQKMVDVVGITVSY